MNIRTWLNNWLKPANLIALGLLFITGFSVFTGVKFFSNKQSVDAKDDCEINTINQKTTSESNSEQNISCSSKSKVTGVTQTQTK